MGDWMVQQEYDHHSHKTQLNCNFTNTNFARWNLSIGFSIFVNLILQTKLNINSIIWSFLEENRKNFTIKENLKRPLSTNVNISDYFSSDASADMDTTEDVEKIKIVNVIASAVDVSKDDGMDAVDLQRFAGSWLSRL